MKIPSKRELRHIASNPSSDIEFKVFFYVIYIYIYIHIHIYNIYNIFTNIHTRHKHIEQKQVWKKTKN